MSAVKQLVYCVFELSQNLRGVFYYPETIYHAFMEEKGRLDLENDDDALSRKTKSFCTQLGPN